MRDSITFKDNKGTDIDIYAEYEFAPDKEKPVGTFVMGTVLGGSVVAGGTVPGTVVVGGSVVVTGSGVVVVVGEPPETPTTEYASKLGLFNPMLNNTSRVAEAISRCSTSACESVGSASNINATRPLTTGAAFEVPLLNR